MYIMCIDYNGPCTSYYTHIQISVEVSWTYLPTLEVGIRRFSSFCISFSSSASVLSNTINDLAILAVSPANACK